MLYLDDQNQTQVYAADTGAANAYAVALANSPGSYVAGLRVVFKVSNANTGASTLNVNSLGTKNITKSGTTALAGGDLKAGQIVTAVYDGTQFQLQGVASSGGSSVLGPVSTILGCLTWLDAGQLTGLSDGNSVATWDDMARGVPLGTAGTAPIYKTGIINGLPIIRFAGSSSMQNLLPVNYLQYTLFMVLKISSLSQAYSAVWGSDSTTGFFIKSSGKTALYFNNNSEWDGSGSTTFGTSIFQIVTMKVGPAGYSSRVALAADASNGTLGTVASTPAFQLGNQVGQSGRGFSGDIAEFLMYSRQLSSTDTTTIENYLKAKYGL
jgi:hypothetical protein